MGINVIKNWVQIDDTHNKLVNTSVADNPTKGEVDWLNVHYIFTRNKIQEKEGDGNPLIYAMKDIKNFKIVPLYRTKVIARATAIAQIISADLEVDVVIPVPSSNQFAQEVAEIASVAFGCAVLGSDFIRKRTLGEMYALYNDKPLKLTDAERRHFNRQLSAWKTSPGRTFAMKEVPPQVRHHFSPFTLNAPCVDLKDKRVLLVDDILSSGSSLLSAADVCKAAGATNVTGLCFLSALSP